MGGPSIRVRTSEKGELEANGLIDTRGQLTTSLTYTLFKDRVDQIQLSNDSRKEVLQLFIQGSTGNTVGGQEAAPSVQGGIRFRF